MNQPAPAPALLDLLQLPPTPPCARLGAPLAPRYDWADAPVVEAVLGLPPPCTAPAPLTRAEALLDAGCWAIATGGLLGLAVQAWHAMAA